MKTVAHYRANGWDIYDLRDTSKPIGRIEESQIDDPQNFDPNIFPWEDIPGTTILQSEWERMGE